MGLFYSTGATMAKTAKKSSGPHSARNHTIAGGGERYGRSAMYKKRATYKVKKTAVAPKKAEVAAFKTKAVGGDKNGKERKVPTTRAERFYPTEDESKPMPYAHKAASKVTAKLRSSIKPGTVLILLAGPYKGNGVPARRVNQSYRDRHVDHGGRDGCGCGQ